MMCDSLHVIPTTLQRDRITKVVSEVDRRIYDVFRIKYQGIAAAIETVCLLLRVDGLIRDAHIISEHQETTPNERNGYLPTRTKSCSGYVERESSPPSTSSTPMKHDQQQLYERERRMEQTKQFYGKDQHIRRLLVEESETIISN